MKAIFFSAIFSLSLFTSGCTTAPERQQEQISQGVYGEHDAMAVGRFDLAKNFNDDLVKTVPPPKKRLKVKALTVNGSN